MKNNCWLCLVPTMLLGAVSIQSAPPSAPAPDPAPPIAERGPHHRIWPGSGGVPSDRARSTNPGAAWTELATGLHYFENGEWKETREEIEITNGVAVARRGPHKAAFASNLHSPGAIELVSPDGKRFRSHVLGLAYTDAATGRSVMIATVKDCAGALLPPRQIVYADAFDGDCEADVRYTYTRRGFEQDIILRQAPPSPAEWGLSPETTRLEVFTEFIELPTHRATDVVLRREANRARAARMVEPDLVDQQLDFGAMHFGPGRAFPLNDPSFSRRAVPTGKSLEVIDGRILLIEKVDYQALREPLAHLPQAAAADHRPPAVPVAGRSAFARLLPARPAGAAGRWNARQLARMDSNRLGLVLDYLAVNASLANWRFRCDTTYLVKDTVDLHGITVLEGTVIKFAPGASLQIWGELDCQTSTYRPAIFTARDDHAIGWATGRSTDWPRGTYAGPALAFRGAGRRYALHHVSIRHADTAIRLDDHVDLDLAHAQIVRGRVGIDWNDRSDLTCRNFLLADLDTAFQSVSGAPPVRGEHGTVHRVTQLIGDATSPCRLTNCLLVAITNNNTLFEGERVVSILRDVGVFQTAGGGAHYLSESSPHRNAGTHIIDPALRVQLRRLTTRSPMGLSGDLTHDTVLRRQARPDTDQPDLGYHYPIIDYACSGLRIANARLTVADGVTLGLEPTGVAPELRLDSGAEFVARGQPQQLTRLVQSSAIQEGSATARPTGAFAPFVQVQTRPAVHPTLRWRWVESVQAGGAGIHLTGQGPLQTEPFVFRDCQFAGARISVGDIGLAFTNCIFDRVHLEVDASDDEPLRHFHQNFFRGGTVQIELPTSTQVHARNNFFEQTVLRVAGTWHHSHNAYVAGCDRLPPASPTDRVLTEVQFQAGPLGAYYYPSGGGSGTLATLIDAGSANAALLGLAHQTSRADQTPEGASRVDIGFHYMATDGGGQPLDLDGDGIADHLEDTNGNGSMDSGETDWERYTSSHQLTGLPAVQVFTPLK